MKTRLALLAALTFGCATAPPPRSPAEELAARLKSSIVKLKVRTKIGVLPLTDSEGQVYLLGEYLAESLVTSLAGAEGYDVIERSRLDQVLKESELSASNVLRDDAIISIGKLLGADALVIGTVQALGPSVDVNCRLVDVASGRILGTAQAKLDRAEYAELLTPKKNQRGEGDGKRRLKRSEEPVETRRVSPAVRVDPPPPIESHAFNIGASVQVHWGSSWYAATVLERRGSEYKIHYTGWGDNWDEWVGPDRIK